MDQEVRKILNEGPFSFLLTLRFFAFLAYVGILPRVLGSEKKYIKADSMNFSTSVRDSSKQKNIIVHRNELGARISKI